MRFSGAGMPTFGQEIDSAPARGRFRKIEVGLDGLNDLVTDPVQRVQAGERILKDHSDALAPDPAHFFRRQIVDPRPRQVDLAAGNAAGRIDQADDREAGDGFSGAGLADHAQNFPLGDVEGNPVDGAQPATAGDELHPEIAHGENGFGHAIGSKVAAVLIGVSD